MSSARDQVVQSLRQMALSLQLEGANAFRVQAYERAAARIAATREEDLQRLVREGQLATLPGIGKSLAEHVTELVKTGHLTALDALGERYPAELRALVRIPAIGPRRALALWNALGTADLQALAAAAREGKVRHVPGFGATTEKSLLRSIEQLLAEGVTERRRLGDVLPIAEEALAWIREGPGILRSSIAGSIRRWSETVKDVDLVASASKARPLLEHLTRWPRVARVLGSGESLTSVLLLEGDLQIDLRVVKDVDFATALHHFTGSKAHHLRLRTLARRKGLTISEWGVHDLKGRKKRVPDEASLYALLGMQFIPPELREDTGEVEAALEGTLPTDLVTEADVRGVVHSHSLWSDGKATLSQMAEAAKAQGMRYLTVTDHSQTASYAGGLAPAELRRQWQEIDGINERLKGFRLLKGIESDILEDGSLDLPDELLARLDVVIGSIHTRHGMDEAQMTTRILKALDHPRLDILGHPTGRLILARPPYGLGMERVLEKAGERGVVVEVNGNPRRLDLSAEHVRQALARGVRLSLSCDSHSVRELGHLRFAVATARRGWARRDAIVNTLSASRFQAALRHSRT